MNENLKDQDVLVVKEKGSNELHVANADKDGKLKSDFLLWPKKMEYFWAQRW